MRRTMALSMVMVMVLPTFALAHTPDQLEAWRTDWQDRAAGGLTQALVSEYREMELRHRPPAQIDAQGPLRSNPGHRGMGSGVEQWRPLVAVYFPGEVEVALAVMACESGGNPNAYNPSGAAGLMQVMPFWFARYGGDPFDPANNLRVAALVRATQGWGAWVCY